MIDALARLGVPPFVGEGFSFETQTRAGHRCTRFALACTHGHLAVMDLADAQAQRLIAAELAALPRHVARWAASNVSLWDCVCSGYAPPLGRYVYERLGGPAVEAPLGATPLLPPASYPLAAYGVAAMREVVRGEVQLRYTLNARPEFATGCRVSLLAGATLLLEETVRLVPAADLRAAYAAGERLAAQWLAGRGIDVDYLRSLG